MNKLALASFGVAVVALVALIACGVQSELAPTPTEPTSTPAKPTATAEPTSAPRVASPFLNVIVPPCIPYPGSKVDPCRRRNTWPSHNPWVQVDVEYPEVITPLEDSLLGQTRIPYFVGQFVVRAIPIPGTTRCDRTEYSLSTSVLRNPNTQFGKGGGVVYCHVELAVNEYIFGSGPDRITMNTGVRIGDVDADERAKLAKIAGRRIEGSEWIIFLSSPWDYGVASWKSAWTLDVQINEEGEVVVIRGNKKYYEENFPEHRAANLSRLEFNLNEFRAIVQSSMKEFVKRTGGRLGADPDGYGDPYPMFAADTRPETLMDFMLQNRVVQALEVTPVGPPPVPGEDDPNPDGLRINDIIATRVAGGSPVPGGLTDFDTPTPIVEDDLSPTAEATATVGPEPTVTPESAPTPEPEVVPTATPEPEVEPTATPETEPTATPDPDAPVPPGDDDTDQGAPGETGNEGPGETGNGDGNGGQDGNGDTPGG